MKNEPKTDVLLRMMEQPERYTEEQWHDILSDNECRELYTLMAMTRGSLDAAKADAELTDEEIEEEWKKVKDPPITLQDPPITLPVREGVVTFGKCVFFSIFLNNIVAIIENYAFFEIIFYLLYDIIGVI